MATLDNTSCSKLFKEKMNNVGPSTAPWGSHLPASIADQYSWIWQETGKLNVFLQKRRSGSSHELQAHKPNIRGRSNTQKKF